MRLLVSVLLGVGALALFILAYDSRRTPHVPMPPADWWGWQQTIRDDRYNAFLSHIHFHIVPNFTVVGYEVRQVQAGLMRELQEDMAARLDLARPEQLPNIIRLNGSGPLLLPNSPLHSRLLDATRPLMEEWAGTKLLNHNAFGIRIYQRGNVLLRHVDRPRLVISAIVHVASDAAEPWPLVIADNTGKEHAVTLDPGQMLFYESTRLVHGRPTPFNGSYFASVFLHYTPAQWTFTAEQANEHLPADWDRGTIREEL